MSKRVSDQTCVDIQVRMMRWEGELDQLRKLVQDEGRQDSSLMGAMKELQRAIVNVHRSAGLEQER